ncbi:NAD/NADP-dependent betaine aldehyde dehydrogenase [Paraburkholderia kirstenboschensis]|uniref:aldehyde dehydrogenase family protein n=2 Tax=Paraburkholderia kirstenboschensis TaxID=1245436 RepID=UPI00191A5173|nr:aldehyde dehydrogenase family protein [Paraburkholderia kirstenboschensis]CAD6560672.1 NAD/NADP-dependent betaine aldehyde dehydrogenase [Paraburkholderia kirstenboschensis]
MNAQLQMGPKAWSEALFTGEWSKATNVLRVTEPATGEELACVGRASADDIRKSAAIARNAQKSWAAKPLLERAAIFRRAAQITERRTSELMEWIVRETGAVPPKAMFEITSVINHMHEAAAMLTQPKGLLLPYDGSGLSIARPIASPQTRSAREG